MRFSQKAQLGKSSVLTKVSFELSRKHYLPFTDLVKHTADWNTYHPKGVRSGLISSWQCIQMTRNGMFFHIPTRPTTGWLDCSQYIHYSHQVHFSLFPSCTTLFKDFHVVNGPQLQLYPLQLHSTSPLQNQCALPPPLSLSLSWYKHWPRNYKTVKYKLNSS